MGLADRRTKQRIPHDPRNLSWVDDASRFGSLYLSKLGFDHTNKDATLGLSGSGLSEHLKVHHKLDLLGIGAQHTKDPNGLAWKQNRDFENLLKRLNAGVDGAREEEDGWTEGIVNDGFHRAKGETGIEDIVEDTEGKKRNKKRKREQDNDDTGKKKRRDKKRKVNGQSPGSPPPLFKDEATDPKGKHSVKKGKIDDTSAVTQEGCSRSSPSPVTSVPTPHRHHGRAHRARLITAKQLAAPSSAAVSEILGTASSSITSNSTSGIATPQMEEDDVHTLNVSSTSVADYFKEKLRLVAAGKTSAKATGGVDVHGGLRGGIGSMRNAVDVEIESKECAGLGTNPGLGMRARMGLVEPPEAEKHSKEKSSRRRRKNGSGRKKKGKRKESDVVSDK